MKSLQAFVRDQKGVVAVILGISLLPVLVAIGAATDYSFAAFRKNTLQKTADAAALAGAALPLATTAAAEAEATAFFLGNDGLQVTPAVSANAETVTVSATYSQPTFIMHMLGNTYTTVTARAVAGRAYKPPCVLTLDPSEKHGIILNSLSKLETINCGIQINSRNSEALVTNSNSYLKSEQNCVVGGWRLGSGGTTPPPQKCPALPDPLASLPTPTEASGACTYTDLTINDTSRTLSPGVYCKNLTLNSRAHVTLQPGIYVFRDGMLKVNSASTVKGDNVLLFFIGENARLEMDSSSVLQITGRTEGPYVDIVIYQDRNTYTDYFNINADSQTKIVGVIYIPNSDLKLNSRSGLTHPLSSLNVIVRRLELNSDARIAIDNTGHQPKLGLLKQKAATLRQ